jgi:hypothetical protein
MRSSLRITEAKLKQIVLEEVQVRLVELYVNQEIEKIMEEEDWETSKRKAKRSGLRKAATAAALAGALGGGLAGQVSDYEDTMAAQTQARTQANIDASQTDDAQFKQLTKQLNNQYAFRWGKGNNSVVHAPGSDGKITVLPPSYSVMVKVMQDKKANAERIEQGLEPIQRFGEVDTDLRAKDIYQANKASGELGDKGSMDKEISNFFKVHKGEFVDAMAVVGSYDELQVVPGSGTEQAIIMVSPDEIDANTYLPAVGMSAGDYYNLQYGKYMGDGEKAALDAPDDGTDLNPELIQKTKERADSLKESKITWKNYKNRKKVLA